MHRSPPHLRHLSRRLRRDPNGEVPHRGEALYEFRRDAGKKTAQKSRTLKLGIQEAALTVPQQHLSATERVLKDHILRAVYGRADQSDLVLAPRLGEVTLVLKAKKKYKALHDTLRSYGIKEIAVLAI